jgi:alcohol dehydrogenase
LIQEVFEVNLLNSFRFELPTLIDYGLGVAGRLAETLSSLQAGKVLVVTDKGVQSAGLLSGILQPVKKAGIKFEIFAEVESNPKDYNVQAGAELAKRFNPDWIVAVGGGSPIDCAKAIAVLATHGGTVREYEGKNKITGDVLPLIAIPTTAGTGSEVTFSSVITDSREKFKFTLNHPRIAPRVALADPEMTVTMPPDLTAATGMDALTHAVEAYTVKVAEPLADAMALYAIELIAQHLKAAVFENRNLEARAGMLLASVLAGIAFSHSDVGAVHCLAEAIGGKYDTAHGVCNAVVLPAVMEYNLEYCTARYARIAGAMGIPYQTASEGARHAVAAVKQLAAEVNLPAFASFGVKTEDIEELADSAFVNNSNADNPRPMNRDDYIAVIKKML